MFYGNQNPYEMDDETWAKAYQSINYILKKKATPNDKKDT